MPFFEYRRAMRISKGCGVFRYIHRLQLTQDQHMLPEPSTPKVLLIFKKD